MSTDNGDDIIRTRHWQDPELIDGVAVARVALVLRHLDHTARGGMPPAHRLELALEHALRAAMVTADDVRTFGGARPGDVLLRSVLRQRRDDPPTESYAETRAVQLLRSFGHRTWRQLHVVDRGRVVHRVDLVIPLRSQPRPAVLRPEHGLLIEIDGRAVHEARFDEDHRRQLTYDALGFAWVSFTPNQIEHQPDRVKAAVTSTLRRLRASRRSSF